MFGDIFGDEITKSCFSSSDFDERGCDDLFNSDIGHGFPTANNGQDDRRSAFMSYFANSGVGQCRDQSRSADYRNVVEAAADMYDNCNVRDPSEVWSRLGF